VKPDYQPSVQRAIEEAEPRYVEIRQPTVPLISLRQAKGRKRDPGMNKLEVDYSALLDQELAAGRILWRSAHEPLSIRLADNTFYKPDFLVMNADCELQIREVKGGYFPPKNKAKTKIAAELLPIPIIICRREKKTEPWTYEEI